jgi:hypothetical protein
MAEYAGYVRRQPPINWGAVAGDIVNKMGDVEKEQEAFREKYDTMASDLYKELGDYEAGKSQEMNQFVYNGIAAGRDNLGALHQKLKRREISPDDFNRATMSMGSEMDKLKQLTTNYDEAIVGAIEGIDNGTLDNVLSGWALTKFGELSNLKDKNLQWMPGQDGYTTLYVNEEGKEPVSMSVATNPNNLIFKRVDIVEAFKPLTQEIGAYQTATANGTLDDASAKEGFDSLKTASINKILSDDNAIASVLAQYGEYEPYTKGDPVPAKGILMKIGEDGKHFVPQVEHLRSIAEDIVGNHLSQMLNYKETKHRPLSSGNKNDDEKKRLKNLTTGYQITLNASRGDFTGMNVGKYTFKETTNGIEVSRKTDTKNIPLHVGKDALKPGTRETAKILSQYTREFSASGSQTEWDEIDIYLGEGKGKDVSIDIVEQEVEGKPFAPSIEDITIQTLLWNGGDDAGHLGVNNADSEEEINAVKPSIMAYIQQNAPNTEVTFGKITNVGEGVDDAYSVPLFINGALIDTEIVFDEQGGKQSGFDAVMKKAIDAGRKKKTATFTKGNEVDYSSK